MNIIQVQQCTFDFLKTTAFRTLPGYDNDVIPLFKAGKMKPVALAQKPRNPMAYHAVSYLPADRDSKTVLLPAILHHIHHKVSVRKRRSAAIHPAEFFILL